MTCTARRSAAGTRRFLQLFFQEKQLAEMIYEVAAPDGTMHIIPTSVVIEAIDRAPSHEQEQIAGIVRKLDFANGDFHHFLRHLATGLAASY
jgi:hypothetical protein